MLSNNYNHEWLNMPPSNAKLDRALRDAVQVCFKKDDMDSLTVKRVRAAAADTLHLESNFFKNDAVWNEKSKVVIMEEVERQEQLRDEPPPVGGDDHDEDEDEDLPSTGRAAKGKKPASHKADDENAASPMSLSKKRKALATSSTAKPRKRQKSITPSESEDADIVGDESEVVASPSPTSPRRERNAPPSSKSQKVAASKGRRSTTLAASSDSDELDDESAEDSQSNAETPPKSNAAAPKKQKQNETTRVTSAADDESDMSSVLDESPPPKRKKSSLSSDAPNKAKKARQSATEKTSKTKKDTASLSPQDEEIKRLQSWLVKCGIRKVWGNYLKPYTTPREKIVHLKSMLSDAGMDGRFSEDKARKIKERRELAADLEAVKEGEKNWGVEEDEGSRPRRRLAKGLAELAQFDDEDTDSD